MYPVTNITYKNIFGNKEIKNCNDFLDKFYSCISTTNDYGECKIFIDQLDKCKISSKKN